MAGIFISYRREDSAGWAGRLHDRLSARFGRRAVFIDVDTLAPGQDFPTTIEERRSTRSRPQASAFSSDEPDRTAAGAGGKRRRVRPCSPCGGREPIRVLWSQTPTARAGSNRPGTP